MQLMSISDAAGLVHANDTLVIGGSGGGHAVPEALIVALGQRFRETGRPKDLTLVHPVGLGDMAWQGVNHLAHPDLLKRIVTGALVNTPKVQEMAINDEVEAYTLPQGALSQLMRAIAGGRPGVLSHVGLHTFVDPRYGGGRQSPSARDELVELITINGREWLLYKAFAFDVAFLRGTTADEDGNITMEHEAVFGEMLSMAQATHRCGGIIIAQVERLARRGTLHPKSVKVPGMLVDVVVIDPDQRQSYVVDFSPSYAGELRIPLDEIPALPMNERKVIARRAAMEIAPGAICNLGAGISTGISNVAAEEGFLEEIILTNEQGLIGGAPAGGVDAGAALNYDAMIDQPYQFDFYDGGGIDLAFLSFAQVDHRGSVNVSRFGSKIVGIGGFQNIAQNAKKVIFSGTFTAGGLQIAWPNGRTQILQEGRFPKFVEQLDQVSYNGELAAEYGQEVLFLTERAVFGHGAQGLILLEIAPEIDIERDILAHMGFRPQVATDLKTMDARLFKPQPMGLAVDILARPRLNIPARLREERG
jgi:propionate CoA-transferase